MKRGREKAIVGLCKGMDRPLNNNVKQTKKQTKELVGTFCNFLWEVCLTGFVACTQSDTQLTLIVNTY